jgi:diaminohydroxyphosphoribosylaminopyrimidine deaminase/5-amino-6-(5-phosphoribosylamino)uracil reductase
VIVDSTPQDRFFMAEGLSLAGRIPARPWPNPPVGALVVRDGRVVGRGAHHGPGRTHAEVVALEEAGPLAVGATLYCTLEPCNHVGRTPPCAPVVARSGVRRLVVAIRDPNPRVAGAGLETIADAGIDLTVGVLADAALELIWPFAATRAFERPFVVLKTATSLDGRFAPPERDPGIRGTPVYLTGGEARRDVHRQRRWADIVLVGEGTLAADHPRLDGRLACDGDCPLAEPTPGYVDTDLSYAGAWPADRAFLFVDRQRAGAQARERAERAGMTIVTCDEQDAHVAPASLIDAIGEGLGWVVLLEGGPTLASAFLGSGLVDRWVQYIAPLVLGDGPSWPPWDHAEAAGEGSRFHLTRVERLGRDAKMVFDRLDFDGMLQSLTGAGTRRIGSRTGRS